MRLFLWIACPVLIIFLGAVMIRAFFGKKSGPNEDEVPDDRYPLW